MSVTIFEDIEGGGENRYFPDPAEAQFLSNYSMDFSIHGRRDIVSVHVN